jgi:prepilin peptidase CpaA
MILPHATINFAISGTALAVAGVAAWMDWRSRRIPNWLTVPSAFAGVLMNALAGGWPGAKASLEGLGLAMGVLLPLVLLRALGAGDWKLMTSLGAFLGLRRILLVLFLTVLIAGLMAFLEMIRRGRVKETLDNLGVLIHGFFTFGLRGSPDFTLDNPRLLKLPFGVAAALATFVCIVFGRVGMG